MDAGAARVRLAVLGLGLALACGLAAPRAEAASAPVKLLYSKDRSFRIPFKVDPADRPRLSEVQLWVSSDQGATWGKASHASPDLPTFTFRAPNDGEFWFAVRTQDTRGQLYPTDDETVDPKMKVIIDTRPPDLALQPGRRRGTVAEIRWQASDQNLDLGSLVVEYQALGAREWRQVPIRPGRVGVARWDSGTADELKVRASVADRARNLQQAELTLPDGLAENPATEAYNPPDVQAPTPISPIAQRTTPEVDPYSDNQYGPPSYPDPSPARPPIAAASPNPGPVDPYPAPPPAPAGSGPLVLGTTRFPLQYEVDDAGPDGPASVEMWVTRDNGRTWRPLGQDPDRMSPFLVNLGGEGLFGLSLVARSSSGLGDLPPAPGDQPDIWVEVDTTPPVVQLDPPRVGTGAQADRVYITWRASDAHLGPRPILISFREDRPGARWRPISGRIENSGRFSWTVPPDLPPRFHVRIDVVDAAGLASYAETPSTNPVVLDRRRPKGRIIGLDPSARIGPGAGGRY